jgi:hypothetical protein
MWDLRPIDCQITRQPALALLLDSERHCIGPFGLQGLDETLCFAFGLGPVGPGAFGFQAQHGAGLPLLLGAVSNAVIGEHPAAGTALAVEPGPCPHQKTHRRGFLLIRQHLDVGQPRGVIHCHMGFLIASPRRASLAEITSDAVNGPFKAGQLSLLLSEKALPTQKPAARCRRGSCRRAGPIGTGGLALWPAGFGGDQAR